MLLGAFRGGNPLERIVGMSSKCCGEISPQKSASDHECVPPISGRGTLHIIARLSTYDLATYTTLASTSPIDSS